MARGPLIRVEADRFGPFPDCVSVKNSGFTVNGTFAEYVVRFYSVSSVVFRFLGDLAL